MKITDIVLHHSASRDRTIALDWDGIRKYHTVEKRWSDIGYHYGIERIAGCYEVLVGRFMNRVGAHCVEMGMNRKSLGVCVVGDFDCREPQIGLLEFTAGFVASLCEVFDVTVAKVHGHGEVSPTYLDGTARTCPGKLFDIEKLRSMVRTIITVEAENEAAIR